jgi:iron(III) transport system substrate-binding protein
MRENNSQSDGLGGHSGIDRRSILKTGGVSLGAFSLAGCLGSLTGGDGGSDVEETDEVQSVMEELPDYYPDDYWQTLAEAQQNEGKMKMYTSQFGSFSESVVEGFNETVPFVDVEIVNLPTAKVYQRFSSEASQDVWEPDVVHTYDAPAFSQMNQQDLLMNYESPEKEHFDDMWKSDDGTILAPNYNPYANAWNPSEMDSEPPNSLEALANAVDSDTSAWDGNFAMYDGQLSTSMWQTMLQWQEVYGEETMTQHLETLGEANPKTFWSTSTMGEWVATGEVQYGIGLAQFILDAYVRPDYGEEQLEWQPADDIISNIFLGGYNIVKEPTNPASAKVFFDWYNSPTGQIYLANEWNLVASHAEVSASDIESEFADFGPMVHENIASNTPFVWGYDKLSKSGGDKVDLQELWYTTFVGGG